MNKGDSWKRTEDIEIDLADLLRRLLGKWRQIFICGLVFAVILTSYGYMKRKNSQDIPEPLDADEKAELTEYQMLEVTSAVELSDEIEEMEEYIDNSIIMKIDSYHKNKIVMLYSIDHAKRQDLQKIVENYLNFILNGGAAEKLEISGSREWKIDQCYLAELITAYQKTYSSPYQVVVNGIAEDIPAEALFYVEVTGNGTKMTEQLAEGLQSALKKYRSAAKEAAGGHILTLLSIEKGVLADGSLRTRQHDQRALLTSYKQSLKTMTDVFSEEQLKAYQDAAGISKNDEKDKEEVLEESAASESSVKYLILGFGGGIFIYCCVFACQYLFKDTLKSAEEMKAVYTFPFYGSISLKETAEKKKKRSDSSGQEDVFVHQKAQILNRIRLACKKQGITNLCAAADFSLNAKEKECIHSFAKQLKGWGIDMVLAENASMNASVWDVLVETGNILMVCRAGTTTRRVIDHAMYFYQENEITVTGVMLFASQDKF